MHRFARAGLFIVTCAMVALLILLATVFVVAVLVGFCRDESLFDTGVLGTALICGLTFWLFLSVFHLGRSTLDIAVPFPTGFLDGARQVLKELGYEVVFQTADQLLARPGFYSFLFGGGVLVRLEGTVGKISGPRLMAELVRKRLRLHHHLDRVQQSIHEHRRRTASRLLKRIQIALKVKPEQIADVQQNVIGPLCAEGTVFCILTILAQSDDGIRDLSPTHPVRVWLESQGIPAEFQRDHIELCEPIADETVIV